LSATTLVFSTLGFIAAAALATVAASAPALGLDGVAVLMAGQPGLEFVVAGAVAISAWSMNRGAERLMWMIVTLGIIGAALADTVWAYHMIIAKTDVVYPGPTDALYLVEYAAFLFVMIATARRYRVKGSYGRPVTEAATVGILAGAIVYSAIVRPGLAISGITPAVIMDVVYIALDVALLIAPSTLVVMVLLRVDDRPTVTPWLVFQGGMFVMAIADMAWFWQQTHGGAGPGGLVEFSYMVSHVLIGVSALAARDYHLAQQHAT
jgi:hypothetical protein